MSGSTEQAVGDLGGGSQSLWYGWIALIASGLAIGGYGIYRVLVDGTVALGISSQFPWGLLISTYEFFLLMGAGIIISVVTLGLVFRIEGAELVLKRGVFLGAASVAAGLFAISISLGRPERPLVHALINANLSSAIWWVVMFAGLLVGLVFLLVVSIERDDLVTPTLSKTLGVVAFLVSLAVTVGAGFIFGMAEARPYYGSMFAPLYFLLTGVLSGVALVGFAIAAEFKLTANEMCIEMEEFLTQRLSLGLGALAGLGLLFAIVKAVYGLTATSESTAMAYEHMLLGSFAPIYWGLGIVVGLVVPLALMLYPKTRTVNGVLVSGAAVLVGVFVTRYEFVIGGQVVALSPDPGYEYPIVSYAPSFVETALVIFAFALCALVYTAGRYVFTLDKIPSFAKSEKTTCTPRGEADE